MTNRVWLVAHREIQQRLRGRTFRVATIVMMLAIAAAIIVPTLNGGGASHLKLGVVGHVGAGARSAFTKTGTELGTKVDIVHEDSIKGAHADLRDGDIDLLLVRLNRVEAAHDISSDDTSTKAQLARAIALLVGEQRAFGSAGLTVKQATALSHIEPIPLRGLSAARTSGAEQGTAVIGLVVLFVMLSQYGTWTLMGVMEEKASRVVEVLLAAVRPTQLLAGKVIGIGALVFGQATILVGFSLGLGAAVGSDLLKGTAPAVVLATLAWLLLGYSFYSWVFAAAGSMVERQDQVQAIAFPITIPLLIGYVTSISAIGSTHASGFVTALAYIPLTAPFAMPVLVALHAVTWWEFTLSAIITVVSTVAMARLAATVYRRAVLRTGRRVRLREVLASPGRTRPPGRSRQSQA